MAFETWQERWNTLFLRLNELEARSQDPERVIMARFLAARLGPSIPPRFLLRPEPGEGEAGPPCRRCEDHLVTSQLLVACSVCLEAAHWECWRRQGGCPHPLCQREEPARQAARSA